MVLPATQKGAGLCLKYLSYNFETKEVRIPNAEVRTVFEDALTNTNWEAVINTLEKSQSLN